MMTESVFDQVRSIIADLFIVPEEDVGAESSPDTIEMWDSIQHLNLVLSIEQAFRIQLSPEEIERMTNVGLIVALINEKLSQ